MDALGQVAPDRPPADSEQLREAVLAYLDSPAFPLGQSRLRRLCAPSTTDHSRTTVNSDDDAETQNLTRHRRRQFILTAARAPR